MANQYVTNIPKRGLNNVCNPPARFYSDADLMKVFAKGVASDSLIPDSRSGRIPVAQLHSHIENLESTGILKKRPTQEVAQTMETDVDKLIAQDVELFKRINEEYCFYEQRYKYALRMFLERATSRSASDNFAAQALLKNTKVLNIRLNSVLEVMNYLAQSRVEVTNANKDMINKYNKHINDKYQKANNMYNLLKQDNAIIQTQREMVRYTEEKNNYTTNQIAVWAALNIVALGTIFYVYRS